MPAKRTLALVVRTVEVFETSLVATLFTRELGKVAVLGKGARRLKSPLQGGLDLLSVCDIVMFPKASETLDLLAESTPIERFASLRRDLAALYAGYYIAELLTDLTDYHDPHPRLFDAARITLRHLGDAGLRSRRVIRFELACLRELGLMPMLDSCAHCGVAIEPFGEVVSFGLATGGVLCAELSARPAARRGAFGYGPASHPRCWRARGTAGASWIPIPRVSRRLERQSVRSSVTSSAIVPGSGPHWECDPMVRVLGNILIQLCPRRARVRRCPRSKGSCGSPFSAALNARGGILATILLLSFCGGCQSVSNPLSQWRAAYDGNLVKGPTKEEMADASGPTDSQNLFERWITPRMSPGTNSNAASGTNLILGSNGWRPIAKPAPNPKADAEQQAAVKLFQQGEFALAEKEFAKIAKDRKGTPWGETAQYYLAETQFQRKKYFFAHDSFELLHKDYPATEYLDKLVSREFAIAHLWIGPGRPQDTED